MQKNWKTIASLLEYLRKGEDDYMKSNKKCSVGIVVILIAIVLMLISAVIYLYSNGKIPVGNGTVVSGDKENNTVSADEQIKVILDSYAMWSMKTDNDVYRP